LKKAGQRCSQGIVSLKPPYRSHNASRVMPLQGRPTGKSGPAGLSNAEYGYEFNCLEV
jgi:hypothetical protein